MTRLYMGRWTLSGMRVQMMRRSGKPHVFTEGGERLAMSFSVWGDVWVSPLE